LIRPEKTKSAQALIKSKGRHGPEGVHTVDKAFEGLPPILTAMEACKLLRISRGTLYAEVHSGRLPAIWLGKRCLRFSTHALQAWLRDRGTGARQAA
jgi:excisionase family DNA binding protein